MLAIESANGTGKGCDRETSGSNEREDLEEILPKIAFHLEKAGKSFRALETFFQAGCVLEKKGLVGCVTMFQKCMELSKSIGDECSEFMRASYSLHLSRNLVEIGNNRDAAIIAKTALEMLEEKVTFSYWGLGEACVALWFDGICWTGWTGHPNVGSEDLAE